MPDKLTQFAPSENRSGRSEKVALLRPPFFSPMSPPLGLGMLKAFLQEQGHSVECFDLNVDPHLWNAQRRYFSALESLDNVKARDGQSKLWALINAHMQAFLWGGDAETCGRVLRQLAPLYGMSLNAGQTDQLHALVVAFFERLTHRLNSLDLSGCGFIGTSTYTTSLAPSLFALRELKARYPSARTVMGGGVFADDLALGSTNLETLIAECPYVDHVVLGEGELLMLRLIEGEFKDKRRITLADIDNQTLSFAGVPAPDFSDFEIDSYFNLSIEGGRSCPFQCSFCSETIQWGVYRKKTGGTLAEQMIANAERYGNRRYFMGDSLINPYINDLSKQLLGREADLSIDGYLRADKPVADENRVAAWARSGLDRARLGLETASSHMLEVMDKRTTPDSMFDALRSLAHNGVRTTTYWVVGHPGETEKDFDETLAFIAEAQPFIYELEAHPYYYYPYGQVASRSYESESVYPEEVINAIKFRTWDVLDSAPTRAERFARLRRMSEFAAHLKIPNIYSMAERYEAEARWLRLSPNAREVY
jgi:radical SAM superfamily enzyme YgiQ (UPF0313 family)